MNSFEQLSIMFRPQLASTYHRQQRQFRKRVVASGSTIEHNTNNQSRITRLPLEFFQPDTNDDDAYTYVITQPQGHLTPTAPSSTHDQHYG